MRAIQITSSGAGGAEARSSCRQPEPGTRGGPDPRQPRRRQLRRHPHSHQLLRAQGQLAARARGEVAGVVVSAPPGSGLSEGSAWSRSPGLAAMREYALAPAAHSFAIPEDVDDGAALAVLDPRPDCLAPVPHGRACGRRRERGGALRRRGRRLAGRPARRSPWRGARDRGGLGRAQAPDLRSSLAPTSRSTPSPRASPSV